jgi:hypothetical protein
MADAAGGQQVEEFIEQGKRKERDEQRLDDFRDYRLLSWEEANGGIGGRKTFPARNDAICRVSRFDPEALPTCGNSAMAFLRDGIVEEFFDSISRPVD